MTFEQITTFLAIYHLGSYKKAAEQLYLPQPTVSNRIKQLEQDLNKLLFVRSKTGIQLTEEGFAFLPFARRAVNSIEEGRRAIDQLGLGLTGKLSIGCNNSFAGTLLPWILKEFKDHYPEVSVCILGYSSREQIRKITDNEFRLSISRYALNVPTFTFKNIYQEDVHLIVSRNHPLAAYRFITMEEVAETPLITYHSDTLYRRMMELTFGNLNLRHEIKYESNNLSLIKHWIMEGDGAFLSGALIFRDELISREMAAIPIKCNPFPHENVFLMYKKGNLNSLDQLFIQHTTRLMQRETAAGALTYLEGAQLDNPVRRISTD
ncbi:LysR family transcriptional regulator [Paenibacillus solisilvae]|uniref:LysR family transcriptional regulator n=1 Tax=Paenibacillus solisilvae TaxID=2486751 RepID=A0ABW0VWY4_9BACL